MARMSKRPPYVTVLVELDDWDDTTDAIVWLVETKFPKLTFARLELGENPYGWRGIKNLEKQTATLTGWLDDEKIEWEFTAEYCEIPLEGDVYEEGYRITIEKRYYDKGYKRQKLAEYIIKGTNRKNFQ